MLAVWLSQDELMQLPTEGPAWESLAAAAAAETGTPNLMDQSSNADVLTLAKALAGVRLGNAEYIAQVRANLMTVMETENGGTTLALGRGLAPYVISADLVGFDTPQQEDQFRGWLQGVIHEELSGRTLVSTHEDRPNNWGTMAGASRAAAAVYLGDAQELQRTAQVFKGYLGDRASYAGFKYGKDLSWQADPENPVGINPLGAMKDGHSIDGVLPDDMRRGGSFQWPPETTGYPWEGLQGVVVQAEILYRAGYQTWQWEDQAIRRAVEFLEGIGWYAEGDDEWTPWLIDARYHNQDPSHLDPQARHGKIMGWTSWTHAGPRENQPPHVDAGPNRTLMMPSTFVLEGIATDDGLPYPPGKVTTSWIQVDGPDAVFDNPLVIDTTVHFPAAGVYEFLLTAGDGEYSVSDTVTFTVNNPSEPTTISFQDGVFPGSAYAGTQDSTIRSKPGNKNFGSAASLEAGGNQGSAALLKWDTSEVPKDATVASVSMTIDILSTTPDTYTVHAIRRDWQENAITWSQFSPSDRGDTVLGTFVAATKGPLTITLNAEGVSVVQSWLEHPETNYGLIIEGAASTSRKIEFSSSEASGLNQRPSLTITYGPGAATALSDPSESLSDMALELLYATANEESGDTNNNREATALIGPEMTPPDRGSSLNSGSEEDFGEPNHWGGDSLRAAAPSAPTPAEDADADSRSTASNSSLRAHLLAEIAERLMGKWHGTLSKM